ncbi:MAG: ThuA domain-containing protein [Blastocatellia bacterium]
MNHLSFAVLFALIAVAVFIPTRMQTQPRVLVFSKTAGFRHDSIPDGIAAVRQLGQQNGFDVDATEDAAAFTDTNLARYQTIIFLSTTGDILNDAQQAAFERYVRGGGGFAGVHSATDTEYDWPWYGGLVGAYFQSHPAIQRASIRIADGSHPSTAGLPAAWERNDEWYNFRLNPRGRVKTLATLDETTYSGGTMGADHPIAWCQLYDGGRAWYTAGGHTKESYAEPLFRQHLLGGIQFAARIKDGACAVLTATSAASFRADVLAAESIASIFGTALAATTQTATATPLPTTLANTSVRIKDGAGLERQAPLFFVSPAQINLLVPAGTAAGTATFTVVKSDSTAPSGITPIAPVAPSLFAANADGQGVATGVALRVRDNVRAFLPIAQFDAAQSLFVPVPIDLSVQTDEVYLVLFGTGIRFQGTAKIRIGDADLPALYAGAQGTLAGLDQVNVLLPRSLAGRGDVDVVLIVDGKTANLVRVNIK